MNDLVSLTIDNAREIKAGMLELLAAPAPAMIDLSGTEALDQAGLQLIVSLVREASSRHHAVHFTGKLTAGFLKALALVGFPDNGCRTGEQFESVIKAVC